MYVAQTILLFVGHTYNYYLQFDSALHHFWFSLFLYESSYNP